MAALLTTSSVLLCPHGGSVTAVSSNQRAQVDGAFVLRPSDTFLVSGCSFNPGPPHPCVSVQWLSFSQRCQAQGDFALTADSSGLCLAADGAPQGSVNVVSAQTRASGE